jgi:hypothetical protein
LIAGLFDRAGMAKRNAIETGLMRSNPGNRCEQIEQDDEKAKPSRAVEEAAACLAPMFYAVSGHRLVELLGKTVILHRAGVNLPIGERLKARQSVPT